MNLHSTPLAAALAAACLIHAPVRGAILLNEAHIDPPGQVNSADGDADYEYIEHISTTGGAESTDGLWILQVDVRGGRIGVATPPPTALPHGMAARWTGLRCLV